MDIPFTFGIITKDSGNVNLVITSIEAENIPEYEIIVVGHNEWARERPRCTVIPFDESIKDKWITRKKNIITNRAKYENVVYLHDYVLLRAGWYSGWKTFGNNFSVAMNPIMRPDGQRYRDWMLCPCNGNETARIVSGFGHGENLLPYHETGFSKAMYFSGTYWVAKKAAMQEFPLDERLKWGEGEDIIWSHQIRKKYNFSCNPHSTVGLLGNRDPFFWPIRPDVLERYRAYYNANPPGDGYGCFAPHWPCPKPAP